MPDGVVAQPAVPAEGSADRARTGARDRASTGPRERLRVLATDAVITATVTAVALVLGHEYRTGGWRVMDGLGYGLICLGNLPIIARRRIPMTVLLCCCAAWTAYIAAGYWPAMNVLGVEVALYTVAARRRPAVTLAGAGLVAVIWNVAGLLDPHGSPLSAAVLSVVVPGVIWRFGDNARQLAERNDRLATLTARLREEQQDRARRAVINEQLRLARELHDVVAHHASVISVQAGLARYVFASDPPTARSALDIIAETAGQAQGELRRMLTLLRLGQAPADPGAAPQPPAPGLDALGGLVERFRAAGLPVEVVTSGDRAQLPPGLDLCAYRVVQEALTNVLKHAGTSRATVALAFGSDQLEIRVTDSGPVVPAARSTGGLGQPGPVSGLGLLGMRERVTLYGGRLAAGPRPDGGFEVLAVLPAADRPA